MGIAGGVAEAGKQALEIKNGQRKGFDAGQIGRSAAWMAGAEFVGGALGRGLAGMTEAGKFAGQAEKAGEIAATGGVATRKALETAQRETENVAESEAQLKNLGIKLGMSEADSRNMMMDYRRGREVRDSYFDSMNAVKRDFNQRYGIVDKYGKEAVPANSVGTGVQDALDWAEKTKQPLSPGVHKLLTDIRDRTAAPTATAGPAPIPGTLGTPPPEGIPAWAEARPGELAKVQNKVPTGEIRAASITQLRAWQSQLRDISDGLDGADAKTVDMAENSIHGAIKRGLTSAGADKADIAALDETDRDYSVFKSVGRSFRTALREKKSLQEVGDAVFDMTAKRPDALRYMLQAADKAGQLPEMQMAFANKVWREGQVPGGPMERAKAIRDYAKQFAPGAPHEDIIGMLKFPEPIGRTLPDFTKTMEGMAKAEDKVKDVGFLTYLQRYAGRIAIYGGLGISLFSIYRKNPIEGLAITFATLAGASGLNWAITHPQFANQWAKWVTTNPSAPAFIQKGMELGSVFLGSQASPLGDQLPATPSPSATAPAPR